MAGGAHQDNQGQPRIGIDLGGTKIEGVLMFPANVELARVRVSAPRGDYQATLVAIGEVIDRLELQTGFHGVATGIGIPGSISRRTGRVHNANSIWLNGRDLLADAAKAFGRAVRISNDANCFALSEAHDGGGAGASRVFGVILGTGVGGGLVVDGKVQDGPLGIGGEWGHNPLPWPEPAEFPGPTCWCGRAGCMEAWVSGPALAADHARTTRNEMTAEDIVTASRDGDAEARATLARHARRLARGLAAVINVIDPDVIVLGGGLSKASHLYDVLPDLIRPHIFADDATVKIVPPKWGDASGVRGAAWLAGS